MTQDELKSLLHYDENTGVFTWKNSIGRVKSGSVAGSKDVRGYLKIGLKGKNYSAHRLAWFYKYGFFPLNEIDHVNGIRSDNKISNLREASRVDNNQNRRIAHSSNKTGFLGVCFHKKANKFQATIRINKAIKHLGYFDSAEKAHEVYLSAKRKHHEFCTI
jgi:hypothetical protein